MNRSILRLRVSAASAFVLALGACASAPRDAGFSTIERTVTERSSLDLEWSFLDPDSGQQAARSILTRPLAADDAVQVALYNNRFLQATFEDLGIARGDLIEAGVLPNPTLEAKVRWSQHTSSTNPEFTLVFDVMDLVRRSKRKNLAQAELDRTAYQVSHAVLDLAADTRIAYFEVQAAEQVERMRAEVLKAADAASQLAERQFEAGNISALELSIEQSAFQEAALAFAESETEARLATQVLSRMMGLAESDTSWSVVGELPEIPPDDPGLEELEALGTSGRLDLKAAQQDSEAARREVSLRKSYWIPSLGVGVDAERDFDHEWSYGPVVQISLPLFDRGQGGVARSQARLRQTEHVAAALETDVCLDIRSAWTRLRAAREVVTRYRESVIPTREKVVAETQRHYNFMLVGAMTLLQAKRDEIDAYRGYIEAVRDYWTARSDVERAVAAKVGTPVKP